MTVTIEAQAAKAANEFRKKHGLDTQPLGDLITLIEQTTGHDVAVLDAEKDEHGLTMRDPQRGRVFIGVARTPHPMRQRSSLAHELGHLVFDDYSDDLELRTREETRADAFARHLLLPQEALSASIKNSIEVTESTLSDIVQRFLVSPAIAAIALREAGHISAELAQAWMKISTPALATKFGWRDHYASLQTDADRVRAPQGLVARATRGYVEGVVSLQAIATLRSISAEELQAEFDDAGIHPTKPDLRQD